MLQGVKQKIDEVMVEHLWELNSPEVREKIKSEIEKIVGFALNDASEPEQIKRGGMTFRGRPENSARDVSITIDVDEMKLTM